MTDTHVMLLHEEQRHARSRDCPCKPELRVHIRPDTGDRWVSVIHQPIRAKS